MSSSDGDPALSPLAGPCLAILRDGAKALSGLREAVLGLRGALSAAKPQEIAAALRCLEVAAEEVGPITARLEFLRRKAKAEHPTLASELTLSRLVELFPANDREQALALRDQMQQLTTEIDRVHRSNARLASHGAELIERALRGMTQAGPASGTYGKGGKRDGASCGPLIQVRG